MASLVLDNGLHGDFLRKDAKVWKEEVRTRPGLADAHVQHSRKCVLFHVGRPLSNSLKRLLDVLGRDDFKRHLRLELELPRVIGCWKVFVAPRGLIVEGVMAVNKEVERSSRQ